MAYLRNQVLGLITRLVDKSLAVMYDRGGEPRYSMLETVRLYAQEKLGDSDQYRSARSRHLGVFLKLAEVARLGLKSGEQITWLAQLEAELDNLRAAMDPFGRKRGTARFGLQKNIRYGRLSSARQ